MDFEEEQAAHKKQIKLDKMKHKLQSELAAHESVKR